NGVQVSAPSQPTTTVIDANPFLSASESQFQSTHFSLVPFDSSVPLYISAWEADFTPVSVVISGLPSDAHLTDFLGDHLVIHNGSITLNQFELFGLTL